MKVIPFILLITASAHGQGFFGALLRENEPGAVSGFTANTAVFDGTDLMKSASSTGLTDAREVTFSIWVNRAGTGVEESLFSAGVTSQRFSVKILADDTLQWTGASSVGNTQYIAHSSTTLSSGTWYHLLLSISNATASHILTVNGTVDAGVVLDFQQNTATIDFTTGATRVGAGVSDGTKFTGTLCETWIATQVFITDVSLFRDSGTGKPIDLGLNGEIPTGSSPSLYYSREGSGDTWAEDSSLNANDMTVTGTLGTGTPP